MPSCLFGDLARERIQQILARLNMASDDIPTAGEQPSLPTASMYEHTAVTIEDERAYDTRATVRRGLSHEHRAVRQVHQELRFEFAAASQCDARAWWQSRDRTDGMGCIGGAVPPPTVARRRGRRHASHHVFTLARIRCGQRLALPRMQGGEMQSRAAGPAGPTGRAFRHRCPG